MATYSFKCQDVRDNFSFECGFSKTAETREELWKEIEKHYASVHFAFSKDPFGGNPKLEKAVERAVKES